jgi:Spy/CpxP family protein refolding chaperone
MKNRPVLALCAATLLFALCPGIALHAQQPDTPPPAAAPATPDAMPAGGMRMNPEKMSAMLQTKLSLTDAQKAQITPILADRQQKMKELQADNSGRPMQRGRKMKGIMEDSDKKINAILTPDQQKQYAALEAQMREQMKERRAEKQGQ